MSGLASPELANNDHFTRKTETIDPSREAGPATRPGPPGWTQQPWYQPTYYYPQPADLPYGPNYFPPYPQVTTQKGPTGWDGFNPFDEEEQERRKKGKELVPVGPLMNGPPPWTAYPGGYGYMAYGPMGPPFWPALPLPQHPLLPPPPSPTEVGHGSKKVGKHVHHYGQRPGVNQNHNVQDPPLELKINREIDGILTPSSGDLTVHLSMDLQEDLEDQLDELTRLSRLGHFSRAEEFIKESLQHHMDNPYVLVQYADLLLQKGDFKGATLLKDDAIYKYEGDKSNSEDLRILRVNWELMQLLAKSHTLDTLSSATTVFEEAADVLYELARGQPPDKPIASTEIKILSLTLQLTGNPALHSKWLGYGGKALDAFPTSPVQLYPILLRQGRIWDFHDLVVLLPTIEDIRVLIHGISGHDLIPGLQAMIADWSNSIHGYDSSTTLALLSMMTHVLLEPIQASEKECIEILKLCLPLALSILENDPGNLKSRPYLRLLLAKSRFAETASRQANELLTSHLRSSPGVFYQFDIASLPIYVPSGTETPDWILTDQPPELKDPVKLVLNSASNLGDLKTEALALQELIRLSSNPLNEFERLCRLQLSHQGDMNSYGLSLASKYLVSSTKPSRETLAIDISRLLSRVASTDYWSPSHEWILNALLYKLEGRSSATIQHMLERSHADYHNMDEALLQEISRKMPVLKDWVDQQARSAKRARQGNTILPAAARRGNRSSARRGKAPMSQRTGEQLRPGTQKNPSDEAQKERELAVMSTPKPKDSRQNLQYSQPHLPIPNPMPGNMPLPTHTQANNERREDARLVSEIRKKLEAEFDRKIETEKRLMREQRDERKPFLEDLKKEVSAIRKEAIEQAEKKARVEAEERAERLRWERLMEEKKLQKEIEVAKAKAAAAELGAKLAAETEAAMQEAERKLRKELESQHKQENEARYKAELEKHKQIEAEEQASEAAKVADTRRQELWNKAEAEMREKKEAEIKARKKREEDDFKEDVLKWAAEKAEKDLESKNQIHLKDAVGRKIAIPFSQGRTWQGMEELIHQAFLHVDVIGPEVLAGHFDLYGPEDVIILPQAWDKIIQPGWNITMKMWPMVPPAGPPPSMMPPPIGQHIGRPPMMPPPVQLPGAAPPIPMQAPPPPSGQNVSGANEEDIVVIEEDDEQRRSSAEVNDDASLGYYTSESEREIKPRRQRIAEAFSSLKSRVFRRRRRLSSSSYSSSRSEVLED